MIIKVQNWTPH